MARPPKSHSSVPCLRPVLSICGQFLCPNKTMHLIDTPNTRAREGLIRYFRTPTPRRDPFWTHIRPTLGTEYVVTPASTYPGDPPIGTPKMDHFRPLLGPFGPLRDPSTGRIAVYSGDSGPFCTRLDQIGLEEIKPRPILASLANQ